jgi:hypothetical protein
LVKLIKKEKEKGIIGQTFSKGNILVNNKTIFVLLILKSKLLLQETDSIQFTFSHFFFSIKSHKKKNEQFFKPNTIISTGIHRRRHRTIPPTSPFPPPHTNNTTTPYRFSFHPSSKLTSFDAE